MRCVSSEPPYTAGRLLIERNAINESPDYQRESAVWSPSKRQLFVDSILNGYDIPKLYFHDLRDDASQYQFAVVDGKQRLHALWQFLEGHLALDADIVPQNGERMASENPPRAGQKIADLDPYWRERVKSSVLPIIIIQDATEEDIEELFSRLNNGEPLTGAEKRNAMGGEMCKLIRQIAGDSFFGDWAGFRNNRLQFHEAAAKFLIMEETEQSGAGIYCDLKKRFLDKMVDDGKGMNAAGIEGLRRSVTDNINSMEKIFGKQDPLLKKPTFVPLYYAFCRETRRRYGHPRLNVAIHKFLESFQKRRIENAATDEDKRDAIISEFGRLMQQSNDKESMKDRVKTLTRYFLQANPDISLKDATRSFSHEEKIAIWIIGGKKCTDCGKNIPFEDMEPDHVRPHSHGGQTVLKNAQALCVSCNRSRQARAA